jgi:uncharacterized membrane protein
VRTRVFVAIFCTISAIVITGLVVGFASSGFEIAETREFSIDAVHVDAEVTPEGLLEVTEEVTYTFRGADDLPFSVGTRDFDPYNNQGGTITSIGAYQDGRQLDTLVETPYLFEWDIYPAVSGTYTYELRYTVQGALSLGSDVVELNRQWVGRTSPEIGEWSADVRFPSGEGELLAWAHGPLDGTLDVDDPAIAARASGVPTGTFVETRTAVPVDRFTFGPGGTELLPDILAEEQAWADETNAARDAAQRRDDLRSTAERMLNVLCIPLAAVGFWLFWMIWRKWGRDPERPDDIGDYWRDVPDDAPAVAGAFLGWRQVGGDEYAATLLDLARRGHMLIEEVPVERFLRSDAVEHRFIRPENPPTTPLRTFERRALSWLFKDGSTITKSELVERSKEDVKSAQTFWKGFRREVLEELDKKKYVVHDKAGPFLLHILLMCVLFALSVLSFVVQAWLAGGVLLVSSIVMIPLTFLHLQRTPAGTRRHAEWTALRSYLKDFSRLDEAPAGHLTLWEEYLVAAVALGVSEDLIRGLEVHYPEVAQGGSFATWYLVAPGRTGSIGDIGSFGSDFGAAAVSSFTPQSSGSGGGGGFSGGGGGGGGGGGFGAR